MAGYTQRKSYTRREVLHLALAVPTGLALVGCGVDRSGFTPSFQGDSWAKQAASGCALDALSWSELSKISSLISAAPSVADGMSLLSSYGLANADGIPDPSQCKYLELADGTPALVRAVGAMADDLADGSGKVGLTLALCTPMAMRGMNESDTSEGGWQSCSLRSWLASEGMGLLPSELSSLIAPVTKKTVMEPGGPVIKTADSLWLFSESELAGSAWLETNEADAATLLGEGDAYELYSLALEDASVQEAALTRPNGFSGAWNCWWERTCSSDGKGFLFRSYGGSHTVAIGYTPNFELGVCPGFCL